MIAEARRELNRLALTRTVNLTYGTHYSFDEIEDAFDDYRRDALRAHLDEIHKDKE